MIPATTREAIVSALPWLPLGGLLGWAFFASLRRVAGLYAGAARGGGTGRHDLALALALQVGRLGVAVAVFWLAARQGAVPLGAAFLGFLLARLLTVRRGLAGLQRERPDPGARR